MRNEKQNLKQHRENAGNHFWRIPASHRFIPVILRRAQKKPFRQKLKRWLRRCVATPRTKIQPLQTWLVSTTFTAAQFPLAPQANLKRNLKPTYRKKLQKS